MMARVEFLSPLIGTCPLRTALPLMCRTDSGLSVVDLDSGALFARGLDSMSGDCVAEKMFLTLTITNFGRDS